MESASRQGVARTEAPGQEGTCLACGPERKRRPEPGPRERAGRGGAGSETGLGCGATGASTAGTPRARAAEPAKGPHMEDGPGIHRYRAVRPEQDAARRKQPENQKELLEMRTTLPSEKTQSKTEVNLPESGIKTERWKMRENSQEAWRLHPRRALVQVPAVPGRGPRGGRGRGGGAGPTATWRRSRPRVLTSFQNTPSPVRELADDLPNCGPRRKGPQSHLPSPKGARFSTQRKTRGRGHREGAVGHPGLHQTCPHLVSGSHVAPAAWDGGRRGRQAPWAVWGEPRRPRPRVSGGPLLREGRPQEQEQGVLGSRPGTAGGVL